MDINPLPCFPFSSFPFLRRFWLKVEKEMLIFDCNYSRHVKETTTNKRQLEAFSQEQFLGKSYLWKITIEQGRVSFLFYAWNVFFLWEKEISTVGSAFKFPSFAIFSCPKLDLFASPGPEIFCLVAGLAGTSAWRVVLTITKTRLIPMATQLSENPIEITPNLK